MNKDRLRHLAGRAPFETEVMAKGEIKKLREDMDVRYALHYLHALEGKRLEWEEKGGKITCVRKETIGEFDNAEEARKFILDLAEKEIGLRKRS